MKTDKEMKQALKTLKEGCAERGCGDCPIAYECDVIFDDECSPCCWKLEKDSQLGE